jgi:hypothetical protein
MKQMIYLHLGLGIAFIWGRKPSLICVVAVVQQRVVQRTTLSQIFLVELWARLFVPYAVSEKFLSMHEM